MAKEKWTQIWGQSHSALSLFYYPEKKQTFKLVFSSAISGKKIRLSLSNTYGKNAVKIGAVTVAHCNKSGAVEDDAFTTLKYNGKTVFSIKKGERIRLDEEEFSVCDGDYLVVSIYVLAGNLRSGNLLDNCMLITAAGNYAYTNYAANEPRPRDTVRFGASKLLGMHFPKPIPLFDSVEILNDTKAKSIVVFGDSISQQGFWTMPFEQRIRAVYPGKYSVINKSVMGNRLLRDCSPIFPARGLYGRKATDRIADDIYPYENISHVILFLGVNDIFEYGTINAYASEKPTAEDIFKAIRDITFDLHNRKIKVIMFNVPPFGLAPDATREKDAIRREVNKLLEDNQSIFDNFFDIASLCADEEDDYKAKAEFIGDDKLHPNALGGSFFASLVPMEFFK